MSVRPACPVSFCLFVCVRLAAPSRPVPPGGQGVPCLSLSVPVIPAGVCVCVCVCVCPCARLTAPPGLLVVGLYVCVYVAVSPRPLRQQSALTGGRVVHVDRLFMPQRRLGSGGSRRRQCRGRAAAASAGRR